MPAFYTPGGHRRYRRRDLDAFLERSGPRRARGRPARPDRRRRRRALRESCASTSSSRATRCARPASAEEGLAALEDEPPDLILLDVMMPQRRRLGDAAPRPGAPRLGSIPVIMFSGKVDERAAAEAEARGARGFIGKPFDPQQLIDSTKQLLPV